MDYPKQPFYKKHWWIIPAVGIPIVFLINFTINYEPHVIEFETSPLTTTVAAEYENTGKNTDPQYIQGLGDAATEIFELEEGFVIIDVSHEGDGFFSIDMIDSNADIVDMVASGLEQYDGRRLLFVEEGHYLFNIVSDGNWSIEMSQEIPTDEIVTGSAIGNGDDVVFMQLSEGAARFSFTHEGEDYFSITGERSWLVSEFGSYSGSQVQKIEETGVYAFDVTADGNWTITVE